MQQKNGAQIQPTETIYGNHVMVNEPLASPIIWAVDDSTAYIPSFSPETLLERYNVSADTARLIQHVGHRGTGPGEMPFCHVTHNHDMNRLLLYNTNLHSIAEFNMSSLHNSPDIISYPNNWPSEAHLSRIQYLDDSSLICTVIWMSDSLVSQSSKPWFLKLSKYTGAVSAINGFNIDDNHDDCSLRTKGLVYNPNSWLVRRPGTNRFAFTVDNSQYLEIFSIENDSVVNRNIIINKLPEYTQSDDGISPRILSEDIPCGIYPVATHDFLFCMMWRHTLGELRQIAKGNIPEKFKGTARDHQFNEEIRVYDWNGNLIRTMKLDPMVVNIAVTPDNRYIYGISEDENSNPILMRYNIQKN